MRSNKQLHIMGNKTKKPSLCIPEDAGIHGGRLPELQSAARCPGDDAQPAQVRQRRHAPDRHRRLQCKSTNESKVFIQIITNSMIMDCA